MKPTKENDRTGGKPPSDPDSLDFTEAEPAEVKPARPGPRRRKSAAVVPPRQATAAGDREKTGFRRVAIRIVVIFAIGAIVVIATTERASKEVVTAPPPAAQPAPAYQSPPAKKPPQPGAPSPKIDTPATAPRNLAAPAIPREFQQAFEDYAKRSSSKAIALALAQDGRYAYGSIAGYATQAEANEEALSECARFKSQSGIQANCRLYAMGDKVVW